MVTQLFTYIYHLHAHELLTLTILHHSVPHKVLLAQIPRLPI